MLGLAVGTNLRSEGVMLGERLAASKFLFSNELRWMMLGKEPCGKVLVRWSNWSLCFLELPPEDEPEEEWLDRRDLCMPVRLAIRKMPITMIAVMHRQPTAIRRASHQSLKK